MKICKHRFELDQSPLPDIKLVRLRLQNVKSFQDQELTFSGNRSLILGGNGRGKSTILLTSCLALSGLKQPPSPIGWTHVQKVNSEQSRVELDLRHMDELNSLHFELNDRDELIPTQNDSLLKEIGGRLLVLAYGANRTIRREEVRPDPKFETFATMCAVNGHLKHIRDSPVYKVVSENGPWFMDCLNKVFEEADPNHQVKIHKMEPESIFFKTPTDPIGKTPLEAMSDGFRSTFAWLFDLMVRIAEKGGAGKQPIYGIVMIDEVDLHLHPIWQRTLLPAVTDLFPEIQFIVTSHSPFIIQSIDFDDIYVLRGSGSEMIAERLELEGEPTGHDLESIIEKTLAVEGNIPDISKELFDLLKRFKQAVKKNEEAVIHELFQEIDSILPQDSPYRDAVEIFHKGIPKDGE